MYCLFTNNISKKLFLRNVGLVLQKMLAASPWKTLLCPQNWAENDLLKSNA